MGDTLEVYSLEVLGYEACVDLCTVLLAEDIRSATKRRPQNLYAEPFGARQCSKKAGSAASANPGAAM